MPKPKKKTTRVIAVFDVPAGAELGSLYDVSAWLCTAVHDDEGRGPENAVVYAALEDLTEDLDEGHETVHCTLPVGGADEDEEE